MKAQKISLVFLMVLPLVFASCKKELSTPIMTSKSITPTVPTTGSILDLGVNDADVHHMLVSLNDVSLTLNGQSDAPSAGSINVDFYTNSDAIIPDGTYTFSKDNNFTPFTYKSATIVSASSDTMGAQSFDLADGTITLTRSGITYSISFDGLIFPGNSFHGAFNGDLSYSDYVPSY